MTALLVVLAIGFAYSMGAHYTGACMGMPHALRAVSARTALVIMAPLALLGATFASHRVEHTVGHRLLTGAGLSAAGLAVVLAVAFGLTSLFNRLRTPTSTIQILVFAVVGAGLAAGLGVRWATIAVLAIVWAAAPLVAALAGLLLTRGLDAALAARGGAGGHRLGAGLVVVGGFASFTMGGNDVANATGSLVGAGRFGPLTAGLIGGVGLAAGVLTWGRPLLNRVAFEIVTVDRAMAAAAQSVQATVVLVAVAFGLFTSMNQALVGAMAGAGAARGRHTVHASTLRAILRGWLVGPSAGLVLAYAAAGLVGVLGGRHHLVGQ